MERRRLLRVVDAVAAQPPGPPELRMCSAAAMLLGSAGVGVSVGASDDLVEDGLLQTICATDAARGGEALQADLGEGPSYTAHRTGRPVQVPDLALDDTWPAFATAAEDLGLRAVFAFPLRSGAVQLGALTLYLPVPGGLTSEQYADALVFARLALDLCTSLQAGRPPDELHQVFTGGSTTSTEIHQASGIVSAQLDITVGAALAVLRAHAFAESCSLGEVATLVIGHRLRLPPLDQ